VAGFETFHRIIESNAGQGYGPIESQVLHCFARAKKPPRIIEIGSGISTFCLLEADRRNRKEGGHGSEITCIEPYPRPALRASKVKLLTTPCQLVPPATFRSLVRGDLLFIDSSHAVKIGSDVISIYFHILPELAPGVVVHIHDITLPYLYPRTAMNRYFGWQETALVLALLTNNPRLRVLACLSALHYDRPKELGKILPDYRPAPGDEGLEKSMSDLEHFPSSLWLEVV
jgi:predicted O-methyltransferase YrrM